MRAGQHARGAASVWLVAGVAVAAVVGVAVAAVAVVAAAHEAG